MVNAKLVFSVILLYNILVIGRDVGLFETKPLKSGYFLDPNAQPAIINPETLLLNTSSVGSVFSKVSTFHGRSYVDPEGLVFVAGEVIDENEDVYTDFNIKGANYAAPAVIRKDIEPNSVMIYGAQDSVLFERCKAASAVLRRSGVLCEWPIFHGRPERFPLTFFGSDDSVGLYGFKSALYRGVLERKLSIGATGLLGQGIADTEFGISYRAVLSNVRIADIKTLSYDDRISALSQAITALQKRKPTHLMVWKHIASLNPSSEADARRYAGEILPAILGESVALMHNEGLWHKYLHAGNISLAGEIVDLDSVRGSTLYADDEPATIADRMNDTMVAMNALRLTAGDTLLARSEDTIFKAFTNSYYSARMMFADREEWPFLNAQLAILGFAPDEEILELDSFMKFPSSDHEEIIEPAFSAFISLYESLENPSQITKKDARAIITNFCNLMEPAVTPIVKDKMEELGVTDTHILKMSVRFELLKMYLIILRMIRSAKDGKVEMRI